MNPHDLEALQTFFTLHDSPENQALPEAERLPMIAGWNRYAESEGSHWYRLKDHSDESSDWVFDFDPDPIDLQAASGVLAGWLVFHGCRIRPVFNNTPNVSVEIWRDGKFVQDVFGPTLLAAQVAAAGAVLGVKG